MKHKAFSIIAGGAVLIASQSAFGVYTGLQVQLHTTGVFGGAARAVYRVYATFTNPNDYVSAVAGSDGVGNMVIESRNATNTAPGSVFYNPGGPTGSTAPYAPGDPNEFGTFATIGVPYMVQGSGPPTTPDQTGVTPGFPNFIVGTQLNSNNIAWFTSGPVEQGRAGYLGDGDAQLRVMIMQLTVNTGDFTRGTVAISGMNAGALAAPFQVNGQTWGVIPAPGVAAPFVLLGFLRNRRRRA